MSDNPEGPAPETDISGRHQIQRPNVAVTGPFGVAFTAGCTIIGVCIHFDALGWGMVLGAACVAAFALWFRGTDQMQLADHKTIIGDTTYFLGFALTLASIAIGFWLSERDLGSILPVIGTALGRAWLVWWRGCFCTPTRGCPVWMIRKAELSSRHDFSRNVMNKVLKP